MRAKTINNYKKSAVIFDFDDTLVKTDAKIYIYKNGKQIKTLTPYEFNFYKAQPEEQIDISDFKDPRFIMNARKYKMWPALIRLNMDIKKGLSNTDIFILTARESICKGPIHNYLIKNGINIPEDQILTIGKEQLDSFDAALEKKKIIKNLKNTYSDITFFDDSKENIRLVSEIGGIQTCLIDGMNI